MSIVPVYNRLIYVTYMETVGAETTVAMDKWHTAYVSYP